MKTQKNKVCSMSEAISSSVHHGDVLYLEGFTHLICFAAGHEIIRQKIKNLKAARLTPDLVYDQLIEAGCVDKLIFSWAGNPGVGSLHALRRVSEKNSAQKIELEEYSHYGMVMRLQAGAAKLPFGVLSNYQGSDIPNYNANIKSIDCPFTGKSFAAVPALNPDVAIIHVQRCDAQGNAQVWGLMGTQKEVAFASKRVVVVAEQIVDTQVIRKDPNRTLIPGIVVDHVVHDPWGCHPSYVQGHYDRDNDFYVQWEDISRSRETYANWLQEFVYEVSGRADYMKKLGTSVMNKLQAKSRICEGVDYGF